VVFVAVDADHVRGMAGGFVVDGDPASAMLWGMWVDPSRRGHGLAAQLVDAVIGWARDAGAQRLRLAVTDCDQALPAAALYRRLGFIDTGEREPLEWNPALITRILTRPT
jgi:GNAT superfamily N-acetyltransferase